MGGVSNAMYTAVTGLGTFGSALSIVSDNVANAGTTAYKSSSARFGDLVSSYYTTRTSDSESQGVGTTLLGVATDFTTGSSIQTGTWSNVMIQGNGFFNVVDTNDKTFYTRDGTFQVGTDGTLINKMGYQVVGSDGEVIQVEDDPDAPVYMSYEINSLGEIYGTLASDGTTELIGTLRVSTFANPEGLIRKGDNLYALGTGAGNPVDSTAAVGSAGQVISGAIEGSNVDIATEMVNMIMFQSDYTANSKAISTASNMLDTVLNLVR